MVQQMEEMCETIHKLNNEFVGIKKLSRSHLWRKWYNCCIIMRSKLKSLMLGPTPLDNNHGHDDKA
ncbi:hypothetical protein CR513_61940, partial [Mucuna pruriens]